MFYCRDNDFTKQWHECLLVCEQGSNVYSFLGKIKEGSDENNPYASLRFHGCCRSGCLCRAAGIVWGRHRMWSRQGIAKRNQRWIGNPLRYQPTMPSAMW